MPPLTDDLPAAVRRFVGRRVRDAHAADDITQDVLLKMHARLQSDAEVEHLPGWVFTVARNAVIDYCRARAAQGHTDVDTIDLPADENDRADALRDLAPCLRRMAERLPEPYRQALMLVDFDGLGQQDLADRAGISLSGAKSRVQRARRMLRESILDCCRVEQDAAGRAMDFQTTPRSAHYCGDAADDVQCGR
jgi:RNA polymerase sigma-70 factor, ECF subfamily